MPIQKGKTVIINTNTTSLCKLLIVIAMLVVGSENVGIATTVTLGDQDFTDGSFPFGVAGFDAPSVGEPAPFDQFRGSDYSTPFSESWTFNYSAQTVTSATLVLGIFDHDSAAPGSQLSSFTVDSINIISALDILFEGSGGGQNEYNIYTINLPASTFVSLSDGIAAFTLTLQGPGLEQGGGLTSGNGAGLDFATLTVVPEPATVCLLGLGGLALLRKRRNSEPD